VLLQREGWLVNHKGVYRLYKEEGLQIRNKRPKRKVAAKVRLDRKRPSDPNEIWAMDFLSDQLFYGRKIRILTIVEAFSKLSQAIDVRFRYTGTNVVATLKRVADIYGLRQIILTGWICTRLIERVDLEQGSRYAEKGVQLKSDHCRITPDRGAYGARQEHRARLQGCQHLRTELSDECLKLEIFYNLEVWPGATPRLLTGLGDPVGDRSRVYAKAAGDATWRPSPCL
jgi:hypothetical protein